MNYMTPCQFLPIGTMLVVPQDKQKNN